MKAFKLSVTVNGVHFSLNQTLEDESWTRLCVGLLSTYINPKLTNDSHTTPSSIKDLHYYITSAQPSLIPPYTVWVAVGDQFLNLPKKQNVSLVSVYWNLCFGDFKPIKERLSFSGLVTAMSTNITKTPHITVSSKESCLGIEQLISPWKRKFSTLFTEMEWNQVCSVGVHNITLHASHGYSGLKTLCRSLGGRLPRVSETARKEDSHECVTGDGFVSWLREDDVDLKNVTSQCPALHTNGTVCHRHCVADMRCSACRVPSSLRYYLYGPVEDFDREYSLTMLPNGSFYFKGQGTSNISRQDEGWKLWSSLHHRFWEQGQGTLPLGRHIWNSSHLNATLTFTYCNHIQFPVDDGTCILRSQRCDGHQDHPDHSDEIGCRDRLIYKNQDYEKDDKPLGELDTVNISSNNFSIVNIDKINAAQDKANIELEFFLEWNDPRLRFVDIHDRFNYFPCEDIWIPQLYLFSGHNWGPEANVKRVKKDCYVKGRKHVEMELNVSDPYLGEVTSKDRDDVKVTMKIKMHISSACYLKLSRYPFGHYTCNVTIQLEDQGCVWVGSFGKVKYNRARDLLDYHLDDQSLLLNGSKLTLILYLSGQAEYHLLSSFTPSGLMFLICYSTLYYPIVNFNERLMASLTSLLVLVALFSQTTDTNVKTPYHKLLDIWYVVLVALCFFVVIVNSLVHILLNRGGSARTVVADDDNNERNSDSGKKHGVPKHVVRCNMAFRCLLLVAFFILCIAYWVIGNE